MKRIGIAASRISQGNPFLYYVYVVLISAAFSLFMFIVVGSMVVCSLAIIKNVGNQVIGYDIEQSWDAVLRVCMVSLTIVVSLFNVFGIIVNLKPLTKENI